MIDPIERQDVLDAIYKCTDIYINNLPTMIDKAETYKAISELSSAEPEPRNAGKVWDELSKVYNMDDVPEVAKEIIGDVMLSLGESEPYKAERRTDDLQ